MNGSAWGNQAFGGVEDWETVGCEGDDPLLGGSFCGALLSAALLTSSVTSREAFLNSLMPWPKPLANSGIRLAPNKTRTAPTIINISQPPGIPANMIFINSPVVKETKLQRAASKAENPQAKRQGARHAPRLANQHPRPPPNLYCGGDSNTNTPRRFLLQAAAVCPGTAGLSSP